MEKVWESEVTLMFLRCLNKSASVSSAGLKPFRCRLRGTKPSRICGMCSRLQERIDWWVWITEQTVHTSPSPQPPMCCISLCLKKILAGCVVAKELVHVRVLSHRFSTGNCLLFILFALFYPEVFVWWVISLWTVICLPATKTSDKQQKPYQRLHRIDDLKPGENITSMEFSTFF